METANSSESSDYNNNNNDYPNQNKQISYLHTYNNIYQNIALRILKTICNAYVILM